MRRSAARGLSLGLVLLQSSDRVITCTEAARFAARADPFLVNPIQNDYRETARRVIESCFETTRVTSTGGRDRPITPSRRITLGKRIAQRPKRGPAVIEFLDTDELR